jgi:hypothetical protein
MKPRQTAIPTPLRNRKLSRKPRGKIQFLPTLEPFEDRLLLSMFTVTNTGDSTSPGSLRYAISQADLTANANSTIQFTVAGTIQLGSALPNLSANVTITGPGASTLTVEGGGSASNFSVLAVKSGQTATVSGLTIAGGNAQLYGGGIENSGTLTLTDCTISGNSAGLGGAIYNRGSLKLTDSTVSENLAGGYGGGITTNGGSMTLTDCTVSGNSAPHGGGIDNYVGTMTLADCTVTANRSGDAGGGIENTPGVANKTGIVTLDNTIVAGNFQGASPSTTPGDILGSIASTSAYNLIGTGGAGGLIDGTNHNQVGVASSNLDLGALADNGGPTQTVALLTGSPAINAGSNALIPTGVTTDQLGLPRIADGTVDIGAYEYLTTITVTNLLDTNTAGTLRFAVAHADGEPGSTIQFTVTGTIPLDSALPDLSANVTITGPGASTLTVDGGGSGSNFSVLTVDSSVAATVTGLTIAGGQSNHSSGGIKNSGMLTLTDSTVSGNSSLYGAGGGIGNYGSLTLTDSTVSGNSDVVSPGGGIVNFATLTLADSTVSGNSSGGYGGGINNRGDLTLTDSTISGNRAVQRGGGIENYDDGTLIMTDCTVAGNSTISGVGGGIDNDNGTATLNDVTLSGNSASLVGGINNYDGALTITNCIVAGNGSSDIAGNSFSGSNNLVGGNALLAPLGNYGGPTQTMPLLPGSPAIGGGTSVTGITADQRGLPLDSPNPDIGAFQSQGFTIATVAGSTPQQTSVLTTFANPLTVIVTAKNSNEPVAGGTVTFNAPASGASAILSTATATIGSNGQASVTATANATEGAYVVTTASEGIAVPTAFALTNEAIQPVFALLTGATITYGTTSATLGGTIQAAEVPTGTISITVNGVVQSATIQFDGSFAVAFPTATLGVSGSPYTIAYAYAANTEFLGVTDTSQVLTVTAATPTISWANPSSIVYGTALTGTQLDASASVVGTLTYSPLAGTVLSAGNNQILSVNFTPNDMTDYLSVTAEAVLNVTPAPLTITAVNQTKVYGTALPALTVTYTGLVNGDTPATFSASPNTSPTVTTTATAASHVAGSPYAITAAAAADPDYTISYVAGSLTVTPAPLTATAVNQTKVYGAALPALTASYSGFVNGDTSASLTTPATLTTAATASSQVGSYAITAAGTADPDYTIAYTNGTLTVTPAPLAITANNQTKVYGAPLPTLTDSYNGFVNGDSAASLTTQPTLSTATASSQVGSYPITASDAADPDYTISYVAGSLTVTPAPLTITAVNQVKVYGQANPALTVSYSGFVNGDTSANLTTPPTITTTATTLSPVSGSPYSITASGAVDLNYAISYVVGNLTINPDATTVTATASTTGTGFGQSVTTTATVTAKVPGSGTPTGSVDFFDTTTGDDLGTVALSGGAASLSTASLPPGSNTITVSYSGDSNFLASSTSTATITINLSVVVLDPTAVGALSLSGNASIKVTGGVFVDSSSSGALSASGNTQITASVIDVHGGVQATGNATFHPAPITKAASLPDPLAGLPAPSTSGLTNYGSESLSGNSSATIKPGIYRQITISGNAKLTMSSGIYIIEGGGFSDSGNASVTGSGLLIDNAGSNYPGSGGTFGPISVTGNGTISLSPAATGPYADVLIFQPAANTQILTLSGNAMAGLTGTVYAPSAQLVESGKAQLNLALVVNTLTLSGNAVMDSLTPDAPGGTVASTPGVSAVSMSWGFPEGQAIFSSDEATPDRYFEKPGVTFIASTGDVAADPPQLGTTIYESDTSTHITALDAILAEWTSSDSYATRINKIMSGVGSGA